jgi:hypothetical protein
MDGEIAVSYAKRLALSKTLSSLRKVYLKWIKQRKKKIELVALEKAQSIVEDHKNGEDDSPIVVARIDVGEFLFSCVC